MVDRINKKAPIVFISYSWESEEHNKWVKKFADELIENGIDVRLDRYDISFGDRLPYFMEKQITESDYVLIICTEEYKRKADNREKGVGYESHIISDELYNKHNDKKFIPVLKQGNFSTAIPVFLGGKYAVDLSGENIDEDNFKDLLTTIFGMRKKPKLGKQPTFLKDYEEKRDEQDDIRIDGIIIDEVTLPRNDGERGLALYAIPFRLSKTPSELWKRIFIENWNCPPRFTTMHRPGIARVYLNKIVLDGTTIEEVKKFHRDTLLLCVEETNKKVKEIETKEEQLRRKKQEEKEQHYKNVKEISSNIKF